MATADRLFYNEGIRAVSVDRVVAEAKVTRVTFYRHFPSKDQLILAYLKGRADRGRQDTLALREQAGGDPRQTLGLIARALGSDGGLAGFRGCEFINAAAEIADLSHPARAIITGQRRWVRDYTEDLLTELGHPDAARLAELLLMLRTGNVFAVALDRSETADEVFLQAWDNLLDGSLGPAAAADGVH